MFLRLTLKELKFLFKSITFYLLFGIILLFYITQYGESGPMTANKSIQPLSEMQFMYTKLLEDYNDGHLLNKPILQSYKGIDKNSKGLPAEYKNRYKKADYKLSTKEKATIKAAIEKMNPGGSAKNENIYKIKFSVTEKDYQKIMKELDSALGGCTYYADPEAKGALLSHQNPYGSTEITDPLEKMNSTYNDMKNALNTGTITIYKLGFATKMRLSDEKKAMISEALTKLSSGSTNQNYQTFKVSYKQFSDIVKKLDKKLGLNQFEKTLEGKNNYRTQTYKEALASFNELLAKDKLTNAYARSFADYMGITAGLFPIFLSAFALTRDRRSRMHELIYCRPASSLSYVFSKFTAITAAVTLCYTVVATYSTIVFSSLGRTYGYNIDYLAFYKYTLAWIVPTILFVVALGFIVSILFRNGIIAIVLQILIWFNSLLPLSGDYRLFKPVIRFNDVGNYEQFRSWAGDIALNRVFFTLLSILMVIAASLVLSRRRSSVNGSFISLFRNNKV